LNQLDLNPSEVSMNVTADAATTADASLYKSYTLHSQSMLPILSNTHNSRVNVSRGKADSITQYVKVSVPVDRF